MAWPAPPGLFTSIVLFDQRVSMWTSLLGLTVAVIASLKFGLGFLLVYLLWIGITRLILTIMLLCSGHNVGPAYPLILYYNQIIGALMKIYVFFRLDKQSGRVSPLPSSVTSPAFNNGSTPGPRGP